MSYAELLALLLGFADKLPRLLAISNELVDLFSDVADTLPLLSLTDEEAALETQVAQAIAGPNAAFDGTRLRRLYEFAKAHPEIVALLRSLLGA